VTQKAEGTGHENAKGSQAIERALAILDCFTTQTPSVSLTDFITKTGLTTSTAHRMLGALERRRFVVRDPNNYRYSVGPAILELAQIPFRQATSGDLVAIALPYMERLRSLTGETAGLHVVMGEHRMCVAELVSHEPMRMASGVGQMRDLGVGAVGKVIAAYLMDVLAAATVGSDGHSVTAAEAAEIRRLGYAVSIGETVHGAAAIAVPVLGPNDAVLGAINITGPDYRWTSQLMSAKAPAISAQVASLSAQLGGSRYWSSHEAHRGSMLSPPSGPRRHPRR
jgi:DNA-binding IclR family transcriptional regulator